MYCKLIGSVADKGVEEGRELMKCSDVLSSLMVLLLFAVVVTLLRDPDSICDALDGRLSERCSFRTSSLRV